MECRTRPEKLEGSIEIVFVDVRKNVVSLRPHLLVCTQHDNQKSILCGWPHPNESWLLTHLVNYVPTRSVYQLATSFSLQSPLMEAEIETAADSAPVNAKWTPDEKNGSMNA